jgi:hypothetical protein
LRHDFAERHLNRSEALLDRRQAIVRSVCAVSASRASIRRNSAVLDSSPM